jgi:membrane protease YdiL (CAAX protease family)
MNAITGFIKRHPQAVFWTIACVTFFVSAFLSDVGLWGLLIYGTFLGGALVSGVVDGRSGLKDYFSRLVRWRVGFKWYVIALALPPVLNLAAFGLNVAAGAPLPTTLQWPSWTTILTAFFWPAFFGIALAEEPGFRGFALPRFLKTRPVMVAALAVAVLHAVWHLPLLMAKAFEGDFAGIFTTILIVMSASVFFTWILNNTNGSVLIAMLLHASDDLIAGDGRPLTLGPLLSGFSTADMVRQEVFQAVVFVATAILIIFLTRFALGQKPQPALGALVAEPAAD